MNVDFYTEAEAILESLGSIVGLPQLEFDEDEDTCTVLLDKKFEISITLNQSNNELVLHHQLGILPEENRYEIVEQLLEANLFWAGTRGATISMERSSGSVMIARAIGLYNHEGKKLTGEVLASTIAELADVSLHWGRLLSKEGVATHNKSTTSINPLTSQMMA